MVRYLPSSFYAYRADGTPIPRTHDGVAYLSAWKTGENILLNDQMYLELFKELAFIQVTLTGLPINIFSNTFLVNHVVPLRFPSRKSHYHIVYRNGDPLNLRRSNLL